MSESKSKLLLWLQKHHFHSKFKLYYILIPPILKACFYIYFIGWKVKLSLPMIWRNIGGAEVIVHTFLTSILDGGKWLTSHPSHFIPGKETQYPMNRTMVWPNSWSGWILRRQNFLPCWL